LAPPPTFCGVGPHDWINCKPRNIVALTQRTTAEELLILPSKKNWTGKAFRACVSAITL
jgi:hypothetical protein